MTDHQYLLCPLHTLTSGQRFDDYQLAVDCARKWYAEFLGMYGIYRVPRIVGQDDEPLIAILYLGQLFELAERKVR